MRSQGPFKVYDHFTNKGKLFADNMSKITEQAKQRFEAECEKIKEERELEQKQFHW